MTGTIRTARRPSRLWAPLGVIAALAVVVATSGVMVIGSPLRADAATVSPGTTPAFAGDAPDPDVVYSGGTYFAFTTGTGLGNYIQALVSTSPSSGYHSYTGTDSGSTALPNPPGWEAASTQTSPGVFFWGGRWLMYYDVAPVGDPSDGGHDCISVAVGGPTLSPGDPQFTDSSSGGLICGPIGSIDPSPFVDPINGDAYLVWKNNDGGSTAPATIMIQQLSADGLSLVGQPTALMNNNTVAYPWESTVEDPDMVYADGTFKLLFSAGVYTSTGYSEGITTCSGPLGPCGTNTQILTTYGSVLGPGGGSLFEDGSGNWWLDYDAWQGGSSGCTNYNCGAARDLFVAPIHLSVQVPCNPPSSASGYRFAASDGGVFDYGTLPFCGSMGGQPLDAPVVAMAGSPDDGGYWEVASDGGIFAFGDAPFYGSMGDKPLVRPVVGMAVDPCTGGYWEVASDGGIFSFHAPFYGSMGGRALVKPIVGIAAYQGASGCGYREVASDGGIFSFNAPFDGSEGGKPLTRPIVGIAADPVTGGYWEVASDGGIFSFHAPFYGSEGGKALTRPVVGMAADPLTGGYWEVASDGGIFSFHAPFDGSTGGRALVKPVISMSA